MINRKEMMTQYASELLEEQFLKSIKEIQKIYDNNAIEITTFYLNSFYILLQKTKELQIKQKKGKIQYICISFLRSSMYTKSHEYCINVYDSDFYLDFVELYHNWKPDFIMDYFESDIAYSVKILRKKVPRIQNFEIQEIKQWYIYEYYYLIQKFCEDKIKEVIEVVLESEIKLEKEFFILFGGYMEKSKILAKIYRRYDEIFFDTCRGRSKSNTSYN